MYEPSGTSAALGGSGSSHVNSPLRFVMDAPLEQLLMRMLELTRDPHVLAQWLHVRVSVSDSAQPLHEPR